MVGAVAGDIQWSELSHAGAFILGVVVGIVIVLRVMVDRYIDHRISEKKGKEDDAS